MAKSSLKKKNYSASSTTTSTTAAAMYDDRSMMAHETETIIPGSFVVLQGNPGDGMCDTISTCPELPFNDHEDSEADGMQVRQQRQQQEAAAAVAPAAASAPFPSTDTDEFQDVEIPPEAPLLGQLANQKRPAATMGMMSSNVMPPANASSSTRSHTSIRHGAAVSTQQQQQQNPSMFGTAAGCSSGSNNDDFIVITDDSASEPTHAPTRSQQQQQALEESALEEWKQSCRHQEIRQRKDFRESLRQTATAMFDNTLQKLFEEQDMWWQSEGRLCIFRDVPTKLHNGTVLRSIMGSLNPGTTVVATSIVYLDSKTLERIPAQPLLRTSGGMAPHNIYPKGRVGWIQMVRIDIDGSSVSSRSRTGYVCLSLDGYPLMAPGLPSLYADPHVWIWRVSCPAGAFVREGLSLQTNHIDTLPYGSLIRVTRRTINGQGLSRLLIHAIVTEESDHNSATTTTQQRSNNQQRRHKKRWIDGWISEFLNPQSGQRGVVAQPLPFPVPALYRVTLGLGAVIRSDIELSSPQIGMAPQGSILAVVGRAFSESPSEKCLERLQLAGNGGWISVRLNRPPPHDDLVVEFVGIDSRFHPDKPGLYHLQAQRTVQASTSAGDDDDDDINGHPRSRAPSSAGAEDLSSIDDNSGPSSDSNSDMSPNGNSNANVVKVTYDRSQMKSSNNASSSTKSGTTNPGKKAGENAKCLICLTEERNATIVHGETGHVACCLVCARILKARGDKCPVCRLDIDLVIQHFWA